MTEALMIAAAAEQTSAKLFRFADGEANDAGETIQPECVPSVVQVAGAFQYFAAAIRQRITQAELPMDLPL